MSSCGHVVGVPLSLSLDAGRDAVDPVHLGVRRVHVVAPGIGTMSAMPGRRDRDRVHEMASCASALTCVESERLLVEEDVGGGLALAGEDLEAVLVQGKWLDCRSMSGRYLQYHPTESLVAFIQFPL